VSTNYNVNLQTKNSKLQSILSTINALPDASGGVELPTLSNPGSAEDLMLNKELINGEGNKVTGTFTIDSEMTAQGNLISQIKTALEGKASSASILQEKTVTPTTDEQTITADSGYDGLSKVTVEGDSNLVPENIVSGVSIFGVSGNASISGEGNESEYLIINNTTSYLLSINGKYCEGGYTRISYPFDGVIQLISENMLIHYQYFSQYEDENGEMIDDEYVGGIAFIEHPFGFYMGVIMEMPDPGAIITIAEGEV
jgi:hypothetical protein